MTYAIGDQVDGYVLTDRGWVPRLELDTSPFRPGHVVNDAILTGALEWQPLRTAPSAPYRVGDVVDGYVLVPSGDWLPLAGQVRDRAGAVLQATPAKAEPAPRTASVRTSTAGAQAQPRPQAQPRAQTPRPRTQTSQPQQVSSQAQPQYRVGQVVNGQVLTADRGWVPLPQVRRPAPRPVPGSHTAKKNNDATGRVLFGVVAIIVVALLRACG